MRVLVVEDDVRLAQNFVAAFRSASLRWLHGDFWAVFPEGAIRPLIFPARAETRLAA